MRLPESAADLTPDSNQELPGMEEAYIMNPYPGKDLLTRHEALNIINVLSGMLLIDGSNRRDKQSSRKNDIDI